MTAETMTGFPEAASYEIDLIAQDQPGLERAVQGLLSRREGLQIETILAGSREAPVCGGILLLMSVQLMVKACLDIDEVIEELENLNHTLMVNARKL